MERCPVEILHLIFSLACTDEGETGRALANVSKCIHAASREHAYQSVAIYGHYQLSSFCTLIESHQPNAPRVRHLFLSDRPREWTEHRSGELQSEKDEKHSLFIDTSIRQREHTSSLISRILRTIEPTLLTLALFLFDQYDIHPLAVRLSNLAELTMLSSILRSSHTPRAALLGQRAEQILYHPSSGRSPVEQPALRRLHIIQDEPPKQSIPRAVSHLAPRLTHLRLSRLSPGWTPHDGLVSGLERLLGGGGGSGAGDDLALTPGAFPATLQRVVVQMLKVPAHDPHVRVRVSPMAARLRDLAARDARRRLVVVRPALVNRAGAPRGQALRYMNAEYYHGVKRAWARRVCGEPDDVWDVPLTEVSSPADC